MSIDRAVMAFAGGLVLFSLALAITLSPLWLWLTAFVGANLLHGVHGLLPGGDTVPEARREAGRRLPLRCHRSERHSSGRQHRCGVRPSGGAEPSTLDDAIAQALAHDPGLKRARAEQDAADAPGDAGAGAGLAERDAHGGCRQRLDRFRDFFGFGRENMTPRSAQVTLQQPIFAGGGIRAAIDQAKALDRASRSSTELRAPDLDRRCRRCLRRRADQPPKRSNSARPRSRN